MLRFFAHAFWSVRRRSETLCKVAVAITGSSKQIIQCCWAQSGRSGSISTLPPEHSARRPWSDGSAARLDRPPSLGPPMISRSIALGGSWLPCTGPPPPPAATAASTWGHLKSARSKEAFSGRVSTQMQRTSTPGPMFPAHWHSLVKCSKVPHLPTYSPYSKAATDQSRPFSGAWQDPDNRQGKPHSPESHCPAPFKISTFLSNERQRQLWHLFLQPIFKKWHKPFTSFFTKWTLTGTYPSLRGKKYSTCRNKST